MTVSVIALIALMLITLSLLIYIQHSTQNALQSSELSEEISEGAFSLLLLSNESHIGRSDRILQQWNSKIEQLNSRVEDVASQNLLQAADIKRLESALARANSDLSRYFTTASSEAVASQLLFNVSLYLHDVSAISSLVEAAAAKQIETNLVRTRWLGGALIASVMLFALSVILFLKSAVRTPVDEMINRLQALEKDPTVRLDIPSTLEFKRIANQVNDSLNQLAQLTVSRDELQIEVAQRKEAQEQTSEALVQLKQSQDRLVASEKLSALGTFVGGIAHELNNPLMGVSNYVSFAIKKVEHEKAKVMLGRALEEIERVTRLVRNLLVYSRSNPSQEAETQLIPICERVQSVLSGRIASQNVDLVFNFPEQDPIVLVSADSLQQILMNLTVNAMDAIEAQDIKQISFTVISLPEWVELHIQDTGQGVSDDVRRLVFDPFFTTKPVGKGTGLGLSISTQLLAEVNGSLELRPYIEGEGAHFVVHLRRKIENQREV